MFPSARVYVLSAGRFIYRRDPLGSRRIFIEPAYLERPRAPLLSSSLLFLREEKRASEREGPLPEGRGYQADPLGRSVSTHGVRCVTSRKSMTHLRLLLFHLLFLPPTFRCRANAARVPREYRANAPETALQGRTHAPRRGNGRLRLSRARNRAASRSPLSVR